MELINFLKDVVFNENSPCFNQECFFKHPEILVNFQTELAEIREAQTTIPDKLLLTKLSLVMLGAENNLKQHRYPEEFAKDMKQNNDNLKLYAKEAIELFNKVAA